MVWINQSIYFFFSVFHKLYFGIFQLVRNWKMSIWYLPLILRRNRMLNGSYSSCRPTTYECIQWKPVVSTSYLLSLVSYKVRWGGQIKIILMRRACLYWKLIFEILVFTWAWTLLVLVENTELVQYLLQIVKRFVF